MKTILRVTRLVASVDFYFCMPLSNVRYELMNKIFEHQTTIYIRMQNIAPPNERLF
jgi:hypothetical protein